MSADPRDSAVRVPLGVKLALVLSLAAALMAAFLVFVFGPQTEEGFLERTEVLLEQGRDSMDAMATEKHPGFAGDPGPAHPAHHGGAAPQPRGRPLRPLPRRRGAAPGSPRRTRRRGASRPWSATSTSWPARCGSGRNRGWPRISSASSRSRPGRARASPSGFAAPPSGCPGESSALWSSCSASGLWHAVVRPVRSLQSDTRAIQRGDLRPTVAVRSRDEVGALAHDFAAMVDQLRASREEVRQKSLELERWNEQLETEVARKTAHLEQALEDRKRFQRELVHAAKDGLRRNPGGRHRPRVQQPDGGDPRLRPGRASPRRRTPRARRPSR